MAYDPLKNSGVAGKVLTNSGTLGISPAYQKAKAGDWSGAATSLATAGNYDTAKALRDGAKKGLGDTFHAKTNTFDIQGAPQIVAPTMPDGSAAPVVTPADWKNVSGAQIGAVDPAKAAILDQTAANQFRGQQMTLAQQLANKAAGNGPMQSELALRQGQEANTAATFAQLASQRGQANPMAARQTMQTAANIQGQTAQAGALARMQEMQNAQGMLANVASGARGQDLTAAGQNAQMQQQANMANYQGNLSTAQQQANLNQQASSQVYGANTQNNQMDAQLSAQFKNLQAQYAQMGLSAQQANQLAAMNIQQMKYGQTQAGNAAELARVNQNKAMFGQGLNAAGAVLGSVLGGAPAAAAAAPSVIPTQGAVPDYGSSTQYSSTV